MASKSRTKPSPGPLTQGERHPSPGDGPRPGPRTDSASPLWRRVLDYDRMARLCAQPGATLNSVSRAMGVQPGTLLYRLRLVGAARPAAAARGRPPGPSGPLARTLPKIREARRLRAQGTTFAEMGHMLGCTRGNACRLYHAALPEERGAAPCTGH